MLLVTYSLPSAHHVSGANVYFNYPPVPMSVEAVQREASSAVADGTRIDTVLLSHSADDAGHTAEVREFLHQISDQSGGRFTLLRPGDPLQGVVGDLTAGENAS